MMLDGTDADGEWSDEEAVRSGSNTGVSETEAEDNHHHHHHHNHHPSVTINRPQSSLGVMTSRSDYSFLTSDPSMGHKEDPVTSILDRIDAEIDLIGQTPSLPIPPYKNGKHRNGSKSSYMNGSSHGLHISDNAEDTDTGLGSVSLRGDEGSNPEKINGVTEVYSEACMTDGQTDDDGIRHISDAPSDLDSVAAQQIDTKFKEIMRKKKVPPDLPIHPGKPTASLTLTPRLRHTRSRPSATMLSTGYGTDNESIRTEDFETKFNNMLVTSDTEKHPEINPAPAPAPKPGILSKKTRKKEVVSDIPKPRSSGFLHASDSALNIPKPAEEDDILKRLMTIANVPSPSPTSHAPSSNNALQGSTLPRPRSLSPSRLRPEKKSVTYLDSVTADQDAREIERESLRIQREMERERRARSASPAPPHRDYGGRVTPIYSHSPPRSEVKPSQRARSRSKSPQADLASMISNTSVQFGNAEDQVIASHELKTLRQALLQTKRELKETEGELKNARELADDARSGLMVIEFKRGNATKDLERLVDDMKRKKQQVTALEAELKNKMVETKNINSLGLTREDCMEIKSMKEENVCLKTKVRNLEGLQLERDELVRQLEAAKDDVIREQKQGRLQRAEMQEELETIMSKLEETQSGWGDGQIHLAKLEAAFRRMEKEKNQIIQEKFLECEEIKNNAKEEQMERKARLTEEMNGLEDEVNELRVRVKDVHEDNGSKDTIIEKLRAQISEMQSVLTKERQDRHKTSSEQKKALQRLKKETSSAVSKLKESMFLDRQKAMEEMRSEVEKERRDNGLRSDDRLTQMLTEHSRDINDKNDEILRLQDKIRRMESETQIETEQQVIEAVNRERDRSEKDKEWQMRQFKEESNRRSSDLMAQVDKEKQNSRELHREMTDLRKELEEQRRLHREAGKEKLMAVAKTKDQMKEQTSAEVERVKFNLKEEHQREVDRLQERLRHQEQELSSLQSQKYETTQREKCALQALENAERTVIGEINEECHRVAKVLGISPRRIEHTSFHYENADGRISPSFKNRPVLNTALANLRAGNEELHSHIAELQQEVESLRTMVETVTKEKEEAIENCRLQMEKQRTLDLEKLKDKLLKEHVLEMSNVIRECAESNNQLKTNNHHLQRYGDAALLEALQTKEDELHTLQTSMGQWQGEVEEKFSTRMQLLVAKEREKYQALQHHSTREQKRISDLQKREIDRLEREVKKMSMSHNNSVIDSNRYASPSPTPSAMVASAATTTTSPSAGDQPAPLLTSSSLPPSPSPLTPKSNGLTERIKQLQRDNDLLRKQRLMNKAQVNNITAPYLDKTIPIKPIPRPGSPTRDPRVIQRLEERMRMGEQEALKTEERAKLDQRILNNKMAEMTRLQDKLSLQNQELQDLERSYNNLHKQYNTSRPVSPTRILNTTM